MVPAMRAPRPFEVRRFATLGSTNSYLLAEARHGAPEGLVAVADHQSAGRGRLGRRWEAPAGSSLLASVLLRPVLAPEQLHLCTAAVALSAVEACWVVAGVEPSVKWPNDLLVADAKLAGVLAEADLEGPGTYGAAPIVVGIGINVAWPASDHDLPDHLVGSTTSLQQQTGGPVDREALLEALLEGLGPRVGALGSAAGRAAQAADLRRQCTTLGAPVRVELATGSFEGTAVDVTDEGHLVVRTPAGLRTVVAGDVVHLHPAG